MRSARVRKKSNKYVAVAWLLVAVTVFELLFNYTAPILSVGGGDVAGKILYADEVVTDLILEEDAKLRLEAAPEVEVSGYSWQIRDPKAEERWVNIANSSGKYLWVTHALVGSMLGSGNVAELRCRMQAGEKLVYTESVQVALSLTAEETVSPYVVTNRSGASFAASGKETEYKTHSIVINYLFDNNAIAFEAYGASVAAGSNFKASIKSPEVVGYAPFRRVGTEYVDATVVEFDLINIREDITINVIYEPALVDFAVHHHFQNVHDDEYSLTYDKITYGKALTGSTVGDGLAFTEEELPGFTALAYEKLPVAADGSTVVEIRYDRNYYLIDFDMAGGYGTEPVYTRYGDFVGANVPIRHGYVFDGWELVSYGGAAPTLEQQAIYTLGANGTVEVPAANLQYKARWITTNTTYTVVFWCENADDDGYSYWGYLDGRSARSGSYVDGADLIKEVAGIDDEQYFTFNENKSDKHVLVEGDGSTVVNVYYTRNYYNLTFKTTGKCIITEEKHQHTDSCYEKVCGKGHVHDESCVRELECALPEHTAHTEACLICGMAEHTHGQAGCSCTLTEHTHTTSCWNDIESAANPNNAPTGVPDGYIYRSGFIWYTYYIYIGGSWYTYSGRGASDGDIVDPTCKKTAHTHGTDCNCSLKPHTHSDSCYRDQLHTHGDDCYRYSCGEDQHVHDSKCNRLICSIPNHTHGKDCTSATKTNITKIVRAKYDQTIKNIWPIKDGNGKVYNSGQRWKPNTYYSQVLVYIAQMPPADITLTLDVQNYKTFTMNYWLEALPEQTAQETYNGKRFNKENTIVAIYNYLTEKEDFFDIEGFNQFASNPAFKSGKIENNYNVDFYYTRITDHVVEFNNNGTVLDDRTVAGVMYGDSLKKYNFEPPYPNNLEPNAYTFKGWYISPGCFDGTEVNWDTLTSPVGDLMLYAKWAPVTHTVRVFKDESLQEQIGTTQTVDHNAFASAPLANPTNGNYVFQGWFYKDTVNGEVVEKAFAFHGIPVKSDMDIYAKWSSHVSVPYRILYRLHGTETYVAAPTEGDAIAGHNKTFDAKAGDQLYPEYQKGYYPLVNSHTITMSVDGVHEFIFDYVYVEHMPYKVRYVDQDGNPVAPEKLVKDNSLSVVTETFVRVNGMMPDAYQKRLILSADDSAVDEDGVYASNVITFYYNSDNEHAYYRVVHYIENIEGGTYREYRSEELVGNIKQQYSVTALTLTGFEYNGAKTLVNGVLTPSGTTVTTTLTENGALVEFFYDRSRYNYAVHYLDSATKLPLAESKTALGVFGEQVVEQALNLDSKGYELVSESVKALTISANAELNEMEFLYKEKNVTLKYQIVGPAGCGSLSQSAENITAISGVPNGSAPFVNKGFRFMGWFTDLTCTVPVDPSWVDGTNRMVPQKQGEIWKATTYYAKYIALETDLTITTASAVPIDGEQAFLFRIQGKAGTDTAGVDLTVSVIGNDSVTVTKLPTGDYTITELSNWSWRYESTEAVRNITLEYNENGTETVFTHNRDHGKWLDGNAVRNNIF